jgi:hypothetical protein
MMKDPRDLWGHDAGAPRSLLSLLGPPTRGPRAASALTVRPALSPCQPNPSSTEGDRSCRSQDVSFARMVTLRADPWSPEYGMGLDVRLDETPARADPTVETADWSRPIVPPRSANEPLCFVDGVRRVELRLLADDGPVRAPALFGAYAVGSVRCDGRASFGEDRVARAAIAGCGVALPTVEVTVGRTTLRFEPAVEAGADPNAPLARLQALMRDAENALACRLAAGGGSVVVVDGPLRLGDPVDGPVVGVVKRFVRRYLDAGEDRLLAELGPGQRTPVFALVDEAGAVRGFSWYVRIAPLRPAWHDHAGIVRCEVRASLGLDGARSLADRVSAALPAFAGRPTDPRAPQNLAPVGGLEERLRHRMGHPGMVRRALMAWLVADQRSVAPAVVAEGPAA